MQFNIRLNNHRKDIKSPNTIPTCKDFIQDYVLKMIQSLQ